MAPPYNGTASLTHQIYVDLNLSMEKFRSCIRKSYKSLISKGNKLWKINTYNRNNYSADVFDEFRLFHLQVAGKITRSLDSWKLQGEAIEHGDAFLVVLRDNDGKMVGGGLFYTSWCEGLYAVGVYDRSLFDLPLGHVIQMTAIEYMKTLGLSWYKLGERPYAQDIPAPTDKELTISKFKEGFSTNCFLKLHTSCPLFIK